MSEMTAADLFMSTAEALGLTPRQRREGLEELQRAAERIERAESADLGSDDG